MSRRQPIPHKHMPERMCVVCRQRFDKRSLTRVVYRASGLEVDPTGKLDGRGAYLCGESQCWERAYKTNILDRALRVSLSMEDKQCLAQRQL